VAIAPVLRLISDCVSALKIDSKYIASEELMSNVLESNESAGQLIQRV